MSIKEQLENMVTDLFIGEQEKRNTKNGDITPWDEVKLESIIADLAEHMEYILSIQK